MAFCVVMHLSVTNFNLNVLLSFLDCLAYNACSVALVVNYVSALKTRFILYNLPYPLCDHPKIKYFLKSMRINRPMSVVQHNIIDIEMLE